MSLIIKDMKLPQHAAVDGEKDTVYKCAVLAHPDNTVELVIDEIFVTPYYNGHDIQRYPLTEIPTPHDDLIDSADIIDEINRVTFVSQYDYNTAYDIVGQADVVVEAEE